MPALLAAELFLMKYRLKARGVPSDSRRNKISDWQLIFLQSRANGCLAKIDTLPQAHWSWPKHTWFQERLNRYLDELRAHRSLS